MLENKSHFRINYPSEKKFGIFFSIIFFIIAFYPFYFNQSVNFFSLIVCFILIFLTLFFPRVLIIPNKLWTKLGIFLGFIVSPVMMFLIFVITFFPIGLFVKLFKIDLINMNYVKDSDSYWVERKNKMESLKKLF